MQPQENAPQSSIGLKQKRSVPKAVLTALVAIVLVAGAAAGAYAYRNNKANEAEAALQSQVDSLKKKTDQLSAELEAAKKTSEPETNSSTKTDEYAGWKKFSSKFGLSFMYPSDYTVTTQIESSATLAEAINKGTNVIEVTSFVPDGKLDCAASGQSIPPCEVKVSIRVLNSGVETSIIPENTSLKSIGEKIIYSIKR